jgi:hypothetical protein
MARLAPKPISPIWYQQFESACDQLNLELVPYGHALREMASKKLEKHLQTLAAEPLEQAHA